jgi:hypothetical protein
MAMRDKIKEHMEIIGADDVHIGTVDKVEGRRIKMIKADSGSHDSHHHYISMGLVSGIEDGKIRLSANGDAAVLLEEEEGGEAISDKKLWNWRQIGIGAAAVGVVAAVAAGAGFKQRRGRRDED